MSFKPSVLLTGGTGSLGAVILEQLLAENYHVNVVLRSSKKSQAFLEKKYARNIINRTLEFTEVPDMTVSGVFDKPASKATYITHVATPLADSDFNEKMMKPAVIIDHNILTAAKKSRTVKRVVITGSIVSLCDATGGDLLSGQTFTVDDWNPISPEIAVKSVNGAYSYSKVSSEKMAWEFIESEKPNFDLVVLLAPSITGKCIQEGFVPDKNALGGMGQIFGQVFDRETPGFMFPWIMDVEDVATIHLKALEDTTPGNQRYVFHIPGPITANAVAQKIREEYPKLRARIPEPASEGSGLPSSISYFDTSNADVVFGTNWKRWWDSVKETVEDILKYEVKENQEG